MIEIDFKKGTHL